MGCRSCIAGTRFLFFFQAEDGIRDSSVTGVQTCALPIYRAQQLTPQYSVLLINLAIAENATKQSALAEQHFKDALRLAPSSPDSYTYYARYLLSHSRADEARALLQSALELSPIDVTARDL